MSVAWYLFVFYIISPDTYPVLSYSLSVRPCYNINIDRGQNSYQHHLHTQAELTLDFVSINVSVLFVLCDLFYFTVFLLLYDLISGNSKLNLWKQRLTINLLSWFYFYLGSRDWEILMVHFSSLLEITEKPLLMEM